MYKVVFQIQIRSYLLFVVEFEEMLFTRKNLVYFKIKRAITKWPLRK